MEWFVYFFLVDFFSLSLWGFERRRKQEKQTREKRGNWRGVVLGKLTGVNNIHSTHCTSSIIENPFFLKIEMGFDRVDSGELRDDIGDNGLRVIAMLVDGTESNLV